MPSRALQPELQYETLEQQGETAQLGMWVFLATEVLFFGGLLVSYFVYRISYWEEFRIAGHDSKILLGTINQAILITSSLTMIMAINFAAAGRSRLAVRLLLLTALLGVAFLGVKGWEYYQDYLARTVPSVDFLFKPGYRGPTELFWVFYFIATGIHALHLTIGIALVLVMARRTAQGRISAAYYAPLEVVGLYWSFVDTVWLFLWTAIYPLGRAAT
jgi:cytochrome c oxidase subunit 3